MVGCAARAAWSGLDLLRTSPAGGCWQARPADLVQVLAWAAVRGVRTLRWAPSAYPFPVMTSAVACACEGVRLRVALWASSSVG